MIAFYRLYRHQYLKRLDIKRHNAWHAWVNAAAAAASAWRCHAMGIADCMLKKDQRPFFYPTVHHGYISREHMWVIYVASLGQWQVVTWQLCYCPSAVGWVNCRPGNDGCALDIFTCKVAMFFPAGTAKLLCAMSQIALTYSPRKPACLALPK